jgi:probable F420-dependent oxidoreductase
MTAGAVDRPTFSVQAQPESAGSWGEFAVRCEALGMDALLVGDHPGVTASPYVALAAAAGATRRIRLGSYVANAALRDPLELASQLATLDVVSAGRALLGVGAGHTPAEWTMQGMAMPAAGARVTRMVEVADQTQRLLAGETVTFTGEHIQLREAHLADPQPVQEQVPLLVGGNGRRVLGYGAHNADIVSMTGSGRTLADGHHHEVLWHRSEVDRSVEHVWTQAADAGRSPQLEVLVQHVALTDEAEREAAQVAELVAGATAVDLLEAPYMLFGTAQEIAGQLHEHRDRWGITRYVIRPTALNATEQVLRELTDDGDATRLLR